MRVRYKPRTVSVYGAFEKRAWESVLGSEILLDLIVSKLKELGYTVSYISTSGGDAIRAITSQTGEVYEVYERPENLPPDVQQVLEELDAATITLAADGTVRIE